MCCSSLEFNMCIQSNWKGETDEESTQACSQYFASIVGFGEERNCIKIPRTTVWFSDSFTNCLNALEVKKTHMENCFPVCSLSPKKVITVLHWWSCKNILLPHPAWVSEWDFTATAEHLWKREGRGEGKAKGGVREALPVCSAKDLNCRKEEPCQQMPNRCGTCQTTPYPSPSAKKKKNKTKKHPLPDFSYLTNKGLFFSLIRTVSML